MTKNQQQTNKKQNKPTNQPATYASLAYASSLMSIPLPCDIHMLFMIGQGGGVYLLHPYARLVQREQVRHQISEVYAAIRLEKEYQLHTYTER